MCQIQHVPSIRVHNAVSCNNQCQSICIRRRVGYHLKKKIKLQKKNFPFMARKKKKRQKGLDLEISSKCQAAWSSKHKNQRTKWPRPTQTLRSALKRVLEVQRTQEQVEVYSWYSSPEKEHILGKFREFCIRLLNLSKDSISATKILSKMHQHFLFIYKKEGYN